MGNSFSICFSQRNEYTWVSFFHIKTTRTRIPFSSCAVGARHLRNLTFKEEQTAVRTKQENKTLPSPENIVLFLGSWLPCFFPVN